MPLVSFGLSSNSMIPCFWLVTISCLTWVISLDPRAFLPFLFPKRQLAREPVQIWFWTTHMPWCFDFCIWFCKTISNAKRSHTIYWLSKWFFFLLDMNWIRGDDWFYGQENDDILMFSRMRAHCILCLWWLCLVENGSKSCIVLNSSQFIWQWSINEY